MLNSLIIYNLQISTEYASEEFDLFKPDVEELSSWRRQLLTCLIRYNHLVT